ncbi:hypothetical protein V0R51_16465 [Pseudomonas otitidis]|uniref:hypothetical protein n=1 Tax=Metapseudomonas otitidis TaxID=319939 RepID=UPI002E7C47F9|nr:hypothetical protein [Pseudomonas otitidis]MEE1894508.1 hypothetical protein [Pseudomonas otitidis]
MNTSRTSASDQIFRSLLQKAVRRGAVEVAEKAAIHLMQMGDTNWLKNRLGVITFEEAWRHTNEIQFTTSEAILLKQYTEIARLPKNKNAAGLGSLGYELSKGTNSVLLKNNKGNRDIRIIAEALTRPDDFWQWIKNYNSKSAESIFLKNAETGFRLAGWPWDKAFALASAYLFVTDKSLEPESQSPATNTNFPYWIAIDKHTSIGKKAISVCAEKLKLNKNKLAWIQFYLESAKCENLQPSPWWEREKAWRLASEGTDEQKAKIIWHDASVFLRELLEQYEIAAIEKLESSVNLYKNTLKHQSKLI